MKNKVDIIVDLQFGSTGKGAIAGYLAMTNPYDTVIGANRPNAGHTFIDKNDNKMVHKVLPNGVVGDSVKTCLIGAGSVFSAAQLIKEMNTLQEYGYRDFNVYIHEQAVVVTDKHREGEKEYSRIGSTQQGAATAVIAKMERDPENDPTAKYFNFNHNRIIVVSQSTYMAFVSEAKLILAEGAQGYSLGIDAGFYPYCTSRNCTVAAFLSDMGLPHTSVRKVIGACRTYPIRVAGESGGHYSDQEELTWADVGVEEEYTTVTQRVRRVFTFSNRQIRDAVIANQCDEVFLNFCNYLPDDYCQIVDEIKDILKKHTPDGKVAYLGFGPTVTDIHETEKDDA